MAIDFPDSPTVDQQYSVGDRTWTWNGSYWQLSQTSSTFTASDTAPLNPSAGDIWFESDTGKTFVYYDQSWVEIGAATDLSDMLSDADADTYIQVEASSDEDVIRLSTAGTERLHITAAGHVIPQANVAYDLGSATNRFRDLYLSGSSIDLGGVTISSDGTSIAMPPVSNISGDFTVGTDVLHVSHANSRVGIGTTSPTNTLHVDSGSTDQFAAPQIYVAPSGHASSDRAAIQLDDIQLLTDIAGNGNEDFSIYSNGAAAHRLSIDSSGNVGIATITPNFPLHVNGKAIVGGGDNQTPNALGNGHLMIDGSGYTGFASLDGTAMWVGHNSGSRDLYLATDETARVTVTGGGLVGIGTTSPTAQLTLKASSTGTDDGTMEIHSWTGSASSPTEVEDWPVPLLALRAYDNFYAQTMLSFGYPEDAIYQTGDHAWMFRLESGYGATISSSSTNLRLLGQGTFLVGNFNASGTKTFRIHHPLPELNETHDLLHNSVESPQADNLYRGHATLVDGVATVNLDEAAGMTEGTFVLLNRDIQCFTSNEDGWTAVRGSVTGNVLTIEAQDSACADTVSWLVVGERQDDEIKASKDTDDEGHLIVEPLTNRVSDADIAESEARMEAARAAKEQAAEEIV